MNAYHLFPSQAAIKFSIVVTYDPTVSMYTLFPLPCHMLWRKYDAHVALLYFYMYHICDFIFSQTFCFEHFG